MSFRLKAQEQVAIWDSVNNLHGKARESIKDTWAQTFADEVFPLIDESKFAVLYSDNDASRPNTPVSCIVAGSIIKEMFGQSDDEFVESLKYDVRYQLALHTTSFESQPISDKTFSRFRKRCYEHEMETGEDLMKECILELSDGIAKIMHITGHLKRMDSLMISSNIRKLSRMELIYTCISNLAKYVQKQDEALLPESLKHYTDPNDFNKVIYHQRNTDTDERMAQLLADADLLLLVCGDRFEDAEDYKLFMRCLTEQTVVEDGARRLFTKEDGAMSSDILQNPSDPDATYRNKSGKGHIGYVGNVVESVGESGSVVTDYDYEPNNYSDGQFAKDHLEQEEVQEERSVLVADGGYSGTDIVELADSRNIEMVTTNLTGKPADDIKADFQMNPEGTEILQCPAGNTPIRNTYYESSGQCIATFPLEQCSHCPYKDQCKPKEQKKVAKVTVTKASHERAKIQRTMHTERFKDLFRIRNGIETVPSSLRRNYNVDNVPRGRLRGKFSFGCKIGAYNFHKLLTYERGLGRYAPNPEIR